MQDEKIRGELKENPNENFIKKYSDGFDFSKHNKLEEQISET